MKRVLVIDDSAIVRNHMKTMLKRLDNLELVQATNGREGLELATADRFDVIITDVHMPEMDGTTMIGKLRAKSWYRETPIVVVTTERDPGEHIRLRDAGATALAIKPLNLSVFKEMIQRFIS